MFAVPIIPADKANHYAYGGGAALAGAALGLFLALSLARSRVLPPWPWLDALHPALCAVLLAWLAGCWKEARDHDANVRAIEAHAAAADAAIARNELPPTLVLPHEVSAADKWWTTAGALPVVGTLLLVAWAGRV